MSKIPDPELIREEHFHSVSIKLIRGDIAKIASAATVCPTDQHLSENSGLTSYLRKIGGPRVVSDLKRLYSAPLAPGDIIVTSGGGLLTNLLFHICVPERVQKNPSQLVRVFILKVLEKCDETQSGIVLIPCLPTDVYGFSRNECAYEYWDAVYTYLEARPETVIREIKFATLEREETDLFCEAAELHFPHKKNSLFSFFKTKKQKSKPTDIELK